MNFIIGNAPQANQYLVAIQDNLYHFSPDPLKAMRLSREQAEQLVSQLEQVFSKRNEQYQVIRLSALIDWGGMEWAV